MNQAKHPLFPRNIGEQVADLNTKNGYLKLNATRLGISQTDTVALDTQVNEVNAAQALVDNEDTRTKLDVTRRDEALKKAHVTARRIIDFYVATNPAATAVDFEALNIPPSGPFPHLPAPGYVPGLGHIVSHDLGVDIPFFDAQTGHRGKPDGVQAIEAYMKIGGEPPKDFSEMTERKVATASPMHMQFGPELEFEVLYLAFRWVGTRGDYGPWSGIYKIIIVR
jgi:hypothetical protein